MEKKKPNPVQEAEELIRRGETDKAYAMLTELVAEMPKGWKPVNETKEEILVAFWDMQEFLSYVPYHEKSGDKRKVVWMTPSYSKAYYLLAYIAVERKDRTSAVEAIGKALALEPEHPSILCEKALILQYDKEFGEALELYKKAMTIRPWAPAPLLARAMRGAGVVLIDLKKLDEAESILLKSLELEPDNKFALNELAYIKKLRGKSQG